MDEYYANVARAEERAERIKRQVWQHRAAACCKVHKPVYAPTYVAETHRNLRFALAVGALTLSSLCRPMRNSTLRKGSQKPSTTQCWRCDWGITTTSAGIMRPP